MIQITNQIAYKLVIDHKRINFIKMVITIKLEAFLYTPDP